MQPAAVPSSDIHHLGGPALRTFFRIAERWGLDTDQERRLLGSPSRSTFFRWKKCKDGQLSKDVLERISYVLGIYKDLHILFPQSQQADAWVNWTNKAPLFGGETALKRMLGGQVSDLFLVRQYLDAQRGWN
jgi:hypothetical protein